MGMVVCPSCRKRVSEQASVCPKCGHPIRENLKVIKFDETLKIIAGGIIFAVFLFALFFTGGSKDDKIEAVKPNAVSESQMEKNVLTYYDLMKKESTNEKYRKLFDFYNHEYIKKYGKYKAKHSLIVEGYGDSVNLKPKPGDMGELVIAKVPDKTVLEIIDIEIIEMTRWDALFYKVEYKNKQGWIPEVFTDRVPEAGIEGRKF